jgi:hypothetical protein
VVAYIARYLACLRKRVEGLPERRERRDLASDEARTIVTLKGAKFSETMDKLMRKWGQSMPEQLYVDERTNEMLLQLEDCMLTQHHLESCCLEWNDNEKSNSQGMPIAILGLGYTLSFYFPITPVKLDNIFRLEIQSSNLSGSHPKHTNIVFPGWISLFSNLKLVDVRYNPISFLPSWILKRRAFDILTDFSMDTPMEMDPRVCSRKQPHGKLVKIVAQEVRREIDHGGDWTILDDVPAHLVKMITLATPHPKETHDYEQYSKLL